MRHWDIKLGDYVEQVEGPGVIGEYPEVYRGMQKFVYSSCCPLSELGGIMSGWFEFVYLEGP